MEQRGTISRVSLKTAVPPKAGDFIETADTELVTAIGTVASGKPYISPSVAKLLASDPPIEPLTPRQSEILESLSRGLSNSDIAKELGVTPTTVREYAIALFQKIGAANRSEAVAIALRKHILNLLLWRYLTGPTSPGGIRIARAKKGSPIRYPDSSDSTIPASTRRKSAVCTVDETPSA